MPCGSASERCRWTPHTRTPTHCAATSISPMMTCRKASTATVTQFGWTLGTTRPGAPACCCWHRLLILKLSHDLMLIKGPYLVKFENRFLLKALAFGTSTVVGA